MFNMHMVLFVLGLRPMFNMHMVLFVLGPRPRETMCSEVFMGRSES